MKNWKRSLHTWPDRYFEKLKMSGYYNGMAMNRPYIPYIAPFSTSYGYPMMVPHPSYVASISPLPTTYMNGIDTFMQNQEPYFDSSIKTESTQQSKNTSPLCSRCKSERSTNSHQNDVNEKPEVMNLTSPRIEKFEFSIDSSNSRSSVFPFNLDDSSLSISTRNRSSLLLELSGYKQNMDSPSTKEDVAKGRHTMG
ncbi:hypothetical protein Ddc_00670 [Ditylenchus destructor]|nr:hypothetical protein Ddc_00670 [Ditylenchus destructor]